MIIKQSINDLPKIKSGAKRVALIFLEEKKRKLYDEKVKVHFNLDSFMLPMDDNVVFTDAPADLVHKLMVLYKAIDFGFIT